MWGNGFTRGAPALQRRSGELEDEEGVAPTAVPKRRRQIGIAGGPALAGLTFALGGMEARPVLRLVVEAGIVHRDRARRLEATEDRELGEIKPQFAGVGLVEDLPRHAGRRDETDVPGFGRHGEAGSKAFNGGMHDQPVDHQKNVLQAPRLEPPAQRDRLLE